MKVAGKHCVTKKKLSRKNKRKEETIDKREKRNRKSKIS